MIALLCAAFAGAALIAASCAKGKVIDNNPVTGTGASINQRDDLKPTARPGTEARLILAGFETPVQIETRTSGSLFTIELRAHGEIFEEESYEDLPQQFAVRMAAGERYDPAVPILKFPMRVGDTWEWSGRMFTADQSRSAKATIRTSEDKVTEAPGAPGAVKVEVAFRIDNGTDEWAQRSLTFWFVGDQGLLKRDFGIASTRLPVGGVETAPDAPAAEKTAETTGQ